MSKSLENTFNCGKCCSSKSLYNIDFPPIDITNPYLQNFIDSVVSTAISNESSSTPTTQTIVATYPLFTNIYTVVSGIYTTIAYFPWDNIRYGSSGLNYTNGILIYYLQILNVGTTYNIDIRVVNSTISTTFASATGVSNNGINELSFSTLPTQSDYLQIQIRQSSSGPAGPNLPNIVGITLEFNY